MTIAKMPRPDLAHCRTCSSRLMNPVYGHEEQVSSTNRLCYEIIERVKDLPALPEQLVLRTDHQSREVKLVSKCVRNGGRWSTTDVLTRKGDEEGWMWEGLAVIEAGPRDDYVEELKRPKWVERRAKPVQGLLLHRMPAGEGFEVELLFDQKNERSGS